MGRKTLSRAARVGGDLAATEGPWLAPSATHEVARDPAGITTAYASNLSNRLPLLYCVLLFDICTLAASFHGTAPPLLTLWLPLLLIAIICWRATYWLPAKVRNRPQAILARDLRRLPALGTAMSFGPMCWSLLLYGYGDLSQQGLVQYITAVTCFAGILSLGQSPRTAIGMAISVMIPSSIYFLMHDHPNRYAVVAVQFFVSLLLVLITAGYHKDFVRLELSRQKILQREQEFEKLAEKNRLMANCDPLTGANNRRRILELFERTLASDDDAPPWLALVDLDGFKHINDTFGHAAGDAVLRAVSARIDAAAAIEAFGRLGGDEFALMMPGRLNDADVRSVLERLSDELCLPTHVRDHQLVVRASIGFHRCQGADVSECLERADTALYRAKADRSGSVVQFDASDEDALHQRRDLARVFTAADLGQQLAMVYQPIVDCDSGQPVAFEALVRWSPDGQTWLPPAKFINLAETTGRIGELTEHVLVKSLEECRAWQWGCKLAINLSARDILRSDIAHRVGSIVSAAGAPPNGIILEITETALLTDYDLAADSLKQLRARGFEIALDDFGTGQSSLSHVHNLPLDHIKIDQSFARDLVHNEAARAIVSTILALARQMRLDCTIEGIETPEQQAVARALGVRIMQGYQFGRPLKAAEAFAAGSIDLLRRA